MIGGHSYPWVYSGPIGKDSDGRSSGARSEPVAAVRFESLRSLRRSLPGENEIPKILLQLREEIVETEPRACGAENRGEKLAFSDHRL